MEVSPLLQKVSNVAGSKHMNVIGYAIVTN